MAIDTRYMAASDFPSFFIDKDSGLPLAAGTITFFSDINRGIPKPVFQITGSPPDYTFIELPNPLTLSAVGTIVSPGPGGVEIIPYFFPYDINGDVENYYYVVQNSGSVLQTSVPNVPGLVSESEQLNFDDFNNMTINGSFYFNVGTTATPINPNGGLVPLAAGAYNGLETPDITYFGTGTTTANDNITFNKFLPGQTAIPNQITPIYYLTYNCSNAVVGEPSKFIQIPITAGVKNLEQIEVTFSFAASSSGSNTVAAYIDQNFGSGGTPSATVSTLIGVYSLTPTWTVYKTVFTIPTIGGMTIGTNGDDFIQLKFGLQTNSINNTNITNVQILVGENTVPFIYETEDMIAAKVFGPRSGSISIGMDTFRPGWVLMNDNTIGNSSSNATGRAAEDTFLLFSKIWNTVSNTYAQLYDSTGAPIARGASAAVDYAANNAIALTKALGRVFAGANPAAGGGLPARAPGQFEGEVTHTLTINEMPRHQHTLGGGLVASGGALGAFPPPGTGPIGTTFEGGGLPHNNVQPTTYMNVLIKL